MRLLARGSALALPLAGASVQCVVTSPPYWGLRDYGIAGQLGLERTPEEYVGNMVRVFREVRRVLRDDGTLWLNLGDSYAARGNSGGDTGFCNLEASAVKQNGFRMPPPGLKHKDLCGIPWMVAFALRSDGWYLRSEIIWAKPNPMPESVRDRPTKAHEYLFLLAKSERYFYDAEAIKEPNSSPEQLEHNQRYAKPYAAYDERTGPDGTGQPGNTNNTGIHARPGGVGRNRRTVWTVATQPYSGAHFATFPEKLVEPCILAGCPKGGIVLDPFAGTATAVRVANRLGRKGIGLDLNPKYLGLADARTSNVQMEFA